MKCKAAFEKIPRDALILAVLVLASSASFGLGFLAGRETPMGQGTDVVIDIPPQDTSVADSVGAVVASKNGTKYYLPTCSGASRISAANKISFASVAEARAKGYQPASGCPGL